MPAVVAIGPSLVDITAGLSPAEFRAWCTELGLAPGGWRTLPDRTEVSRLISRLLGGPVAREDEFIALAASTAVSLWAGSSTLGMLSAMPKGVRAQSCYVSTLARNGLVVDPFSEFFSAAVRRLGLAHQVRTVPGYNPVGFVLYEPVDPDRALATYAGVAAEQVHLPDHVESAGVVLIDTYELLAGPLSLQLHDLISGQRARIGLSLGNARILTGETQRRLRSHIDAGAVEMIFGNAGEYRMLYPELPPHLATLAGFVHHPIRHRVPFCLLTDGTNGLAAHCGRDYATAPATPVGAEVVVNTSGAGDTAAGVFVAGALNRMEPRHLLRRCAELASRVVSSPGSRIVG